MLGRKWRNMRCTLDALLTTWWEEPSFRIQTGVSVFFIALSYYLGISRIEWGLLMLALTGVLTVELINTAIERIGNAFRRPPDPLIGLIKDLGAAAASMVGIGAIVIVGIIFVPRLATLL